MNNKNGQFQVVASNVQ